MATPSWPIRFWQQGDDLGRWRSASGRHGSGDRAGRSDGRAARHLRAKSTLNQAVIQEAYIKGVSTRSVDDLVQAMGMTGISKSQVSRLCEEIDGKVKAFLERPIEGDWPYLWIDATYLKVRRGGRIVSVAVIIAIGVNGDGRREVLGMEVGTSEAEPIWTEFLRKLTRRGLRGVKLVVSDAHEGIKAAVTKVLCATWQRCRVHFMRNVLFVRPSLSLTRLGATRTRPLHVETTTPPDKRCAHHRPESGAFPQWGAGTGQIARIDASGAGEWLPCCQAGLP